MATATKQSKAAQDRAQRESKVEDTPSAAALPGGETVKVAGKATTAAQRKAEKAALTVEQAAAKERKALSKAIDIKEVDELPEPAEKNIGERKSPAPSVWAQRLKAVADTKTGKALVFSADAPPEGQKWTQAQGIAFRVRKQLKDGKFNSLLGDNAASEYRIVVHGNDIYVEHIRAA